jgi:hypothetical protein
MKRARQRKDWIERKKQRVEKKRAQNKASKQRLRERKKLAEG